MNKPVRLLAAAALSAAAVWGQAGPVTRGSITAYGEAVVSVRPDQAKVSISAITQAATAEEAATQNAARTTAVLNALRQLLGASAVIETINYLVTPNYSSPRDGGPPTLVSFTAANTIQVTIPDLGIIGRVIDTAVQAGASRVDSLRLSLREEAPVRAAALRQAAQQARLKAESIAGGLNVRIGGLISASEGFTVRPLERSLAQPAATTTPIEPGTLQVHATVTAEFEVI
jgi:uncharacterized protein YggE